MVVVLEKRKLMREMIRRKEGRDNLCNRAKNILRLFYFMLWLHIILIQQQSLFFLDFFFFFVYNIFEFVTFWIWEG